MSFSTARLVLSGLAWLASPAGALQQPTVLREVTNQVGLDFVHQPGDEGGFLLPEIMGSGGAFLDFDSDGDLDIYLIQAGHTKKAGGEPHLANRLFRQETDGTFTDVTPESGLGDRGYGMGVAVGDIDNDGLVDVFVSNYGADALYLNEGGGKYRDITSSAGIAGDAWSASAVFCDFDLDGDLDLYVTRYLDYHPDKGCVRDDGGADYCSPQSFSGARDALYRNGGDGRFLDVSRTSGIGRVAAPGLGVVCADFNDDQRPDFYVANDGEANLLWTNQANGKFAEDAFVQGVALNALGQAEAGMGISLGDIDADGDLDLFLTHLTNQTNTLYLNTGVLGFEDGSASAGLGMPSLSWTGFGTGFFDYDHDGNLDIAVVNGRVQRHPRVPGVSLGPYWSPYAEPNQLLRNEGGGRFEDVSASSGRFGSEIEISRGLALGDVDNDGDVDVLVTHTAGPARLYRNEASKKGGWLQVRAVDPKLNRDAYGALVTVVANGKEYVRMVQPGGSYLSSHDPRAHFGIGGADRAERVRVLWPDGSKESFPGVLLNQAIVLEQGAGEIVP